MRDKPGRVWGAVYSYESVIFLRLVWALTDCPYSIFAVSYIYGSNRSREENL